MGRSAADPGWASATLDSPTLPGGFRQLSDEAPLRLGQVAGRSRRHARSAGTPHHPPARHQPGSQHITGGPVRQPGHTVKAGLTPKRPGRQIENDEYGAFVRRVLRAYARRVGDGDVEALVLMTASLMRSAPPSPRPSKACAPVVIPGPRSAPGSASPARPLSNDGEHHLDPAMSPPSPRDRAGALAQWLSPVSAGASRGK